MKVPFLHQNKNILVFFFGLGLSLSLIIFLHTWFSGVGGVGFTHVCLVIVVGKFVQHVQLDD